MYNILISAAGRRVSLVRAFKKELQKYNRDAKVFASDLNPGLSAAAQVADDTLVVKKFTDKDYLYDLIEQCVRNNIGMIIPTLDTELLLLALQKEELKQHNIEVIVSDYGFIQKCRDKRLTASFFSENRINSPTIYDKENPQYPIFIKPYDGSLSADTHIVHSKNELTSYHLMNERLIFMQLIDKKNFQEYTVDMYYNRNGLLKCAVPRERKETRGGEISKGVTVKNYIHDFLKEKLPKINGAKGCLTLQLFHNKASNEIFGIEINPRFGGGYPLSYLAGANYPHWLIREYFENKGIAFFEDWEENLLMLRYDDEILVHDYH